MSYLLVGNYGVGNLGDEALRKYFLQSFSNVEWKVLSADLKEGEFPRLPCGIRSFITFRWMKTLRALRKSEGMVFGGGSLFTDIESVRACILWWVHMIAARLFRKKVILAFQGIGPFRTRFGKCLAQFAVRSAHFISVRDTQSLERIKDWKKKAQVIQTFDPVFSLVQDQEQDLQALNVLIVIPRENSGNLIKDKLQSLLKADRFTEVRILSLRPDDKKEEEYCRSLQELLTVVSSIIEVRSLEDLTSAIAGGAFVLTQRYHGALVALALGKEIEVIPQGKSDKLDSLSELIRSGSAHGRKERLGELVNDGERALRQVL